MRVRSYGTAGSLAILVHGGPGASGSMAPVARGLADSFRVLEPFQRSSSATVASHVEDLNEVVQSHCGGVRSALVGHSWGAMLTLAYAAAYPRVAGPMVLIGCGTFDTHARGQMTAILRDRMSEELRRRMDHLEEEFPEPNKRLRALGELTLPLYSYDPDIAEFEPESDASDARAKNDETWQDMVRLQNEGVYPAAFAAIETPVLMLHGAADPHPGRLIRASLEPYLPQLEYCELERCGHYPWLERQARDQFFSVLRDWLARH